MEEMTVPGNTLDDVVRVMCRGLAPGAVSTDEVHEVVESFTKATWGTSPFAAQDENSPLGIAISTIPQFAALQISIGVLWGFALRGLAMRLALDRALGTMP